MNNIIISATITNKLEPKAINDSNVIDVICNFTTIGTERTSTIKVTGWGKTADVLIGMAIGDAIVIEGRVEMNKIPQEDGKSTTIAKIVASRVTKLIGALNCQFNTVNLVGRTGQDPEMQLFDTGKSVCTTSLAVNRRSKEKQTDWFTLKIWGKTGEVANKYAPKGSTIGITGSLEIESWTDKVSGQIKTRPIIKPNELDLLGSKRDNQEAAPSYGTPGSTLHQSRQTNELDVPF